MPLASVEKALVTDYQKAKEIIERDAKVFITLSEKIPALLAAAAQVEPEIEQVVSLFGPNYAKLIVTAFRVLETVASISAEAGLAAQGKFVNIQVDQQLIADAQSVVSLIKSK